jgi:hypothetical protein
MKAILLFIASLAFFSVTSFAATVAVLEMEANQGASERVPVSDLQYLTATFRDLAVKELSTDPNFTIMMFADSVNAASADFVCRSRIGFLDELFTLSAELYSTSTNNVVASFGDRGSDVNALLEIMTQNSSGFFNKLKENRQNQFVDTNLVAVDSVVRQNNVMLSEHGWLEINTNLAGNAAGKGPISVYVDGFLVDNNGFVVEGNKIQLDKGLHDVRLMHPCYEPVEFQVFITADKTVKVDKNLPHATGVLELKAEYNGEPQMVAVYVNGAEAGSTPFANEIPLCAVVELKGEGWREKVDVELKLNDVVHVTHSLNYTPEAVPVINKGLQREGLIGIDEVGETETPEVNVPVLPEKKKSKKKILNLIPLGISAAVTVTGTVLAIVGNSKAKKAAETRVSTKSDYDKIHDDAESGQTIRGVGIGLAIAGAVGIGLSFVF